MEGYSVTEAASVLGVPTERVWELLARGVLSGAPEGETGMRVYLQPRPAPAPPEAKRPNGNGRRDEPELSPFRELLTEFRGLTERYGQALLALGEARGEVATLRSRVDLLEARMDLRLPASAPSPAASWASTPMPFPAERAVVPTVPAPQEPRVAEEYEAGEEEPRHRTRGPRRATESFAEALARAEDPSIPELPGAAETASAMATLRAETDAALPRDLPSADAVPVADEPDTAVPAPPPDALPIADEPDTALPTPPVEAQEAVVAESEAPAPSAPDEVLEAAHVPPDEMAEEDAASPPDLDAGEAIAQEPADIDAEEPPAETREIAAAASQAEPPVKAEPGTAAQSPSEATASEPVLSEPVATEPLEWDSDRYTTAIEEPDWFAAEAIETRVEEPTPTRVALEPAADPVAEPAADEGEPELTEPVLPPPVQPPAADEPTATVRSEEPDEETMLWFGRAAEDSGGASEMEVATTGTRSPVEQSDTAARSFPGSSELDDALAALEVPAPAQDQPTEESAATEPVSVEDTDADEWPPRSTFIGSPRQPPSSNPDATTTATTNASTNATTNATTNASSASRAYRRLRRIFPG